MVINKLLVPGNETRHAAGGIWKEAQWRIESYTRTGARWAYEAEVEAAELVEDAVLLGSEEEIAAVNCVSGLDGVSERPAERHKTLLAFSVEQH